MELLLPSHPTPVLHPCPHAPPSSPLSSSPLPYCSRSWYYGELPRVEAEKLLMRKYVPARRGPEHLCAEEPGSTRPT